jgi:hypothetical protein
VRGPRRRTPTWTPSSAKCMTTQGPKRDWCDPRNQTMSPARPLDLTCMRLLLDAWRQHPGWVCVCHQGGRREVSAPGGAEWWLAPSLYLMAADLSSNGPAMRALVVGGSCPAESGRNLRARDSPGYRNRPQFPGPTSSIQTDCLSRRESRGKVRHFITT